MNNHENPTFKIYLQDFVCDKCGEQTCMGIIGFSSKYHKICDFCLVNELESSEEKTSNQSINQSSKKRK
jgi:ArsR family metal-binding transcriptional regulator